MQWALCAKGEMAQKRTHSSSSSYYYYHYYHYLIVAFPPMFLAEIVLNMTKNAIMHTFVT